ncbi:MAG: acyltransferase family protein, partial [Ruminococcaceae bacterium]|nr:acyltransferase family protein [Oscillospiraceae bacterium]
MVKSIISSTSSTIHNSFPKRDATSDIAKAIGILLMILGHCNGIPFIVRNFIFSFHMPLFFILSGFFFKPKPIREIALSGSRHLVRPYLITGAICILLCLTAEDITGAKNKIIGTIMSNGGWPS